MVGRTGGRGEGACDCEEGCLECLEWNCVIHHHVDTHCGYTWTLAKTLVQLLMSLGPFCPFIDRAISASL